MNKPRKTPTKEQKDWMKKTGYTEAHMDAFWADNIDTNPIIKNLNNHGLSWRDLNLTCIENLPTQKERDLKMAEERNAKEMAEKEAEEKKKMEQEYYRNHFDEIMLVKIENNEKLTEREISELVWGYGIETMSGENRRWTRTNTTVFELLGRYFSVDWEEGLTECQESEFCNQPIEVKKKTYKKTITVTKWVPVHNEIREG